MAPLVYRRLTALGAVVILAGTVFYLVLQVRSGFFGAGIPWRYDLTSILTPLAALSAVVAWISAGALTVGGEGEGARRRMLVAFAVQALFFATISALGLSDIVGGAALAQWSFGSNLVGQLALAAGLLGMALSPQAPETVKVEDGERDEVPLALRPNLTFDSDAD
jgi:hypothetical protein